MSNNDKATKKSPPTKEYPLIKEVRTSKGVKPVGFKAKLTKEGAAHYRFKNRIE